MANQKQSCLREPHHKDARDNLGKDPGIFNLIIRLVSFTFRPLYLSIKCVGPTACLEGTAKIKITVLPKIGVIPVACHSQALYRL